MGLPNASCAAGWSVFSTQVCRPTTMAQFSMAGGLISTLLAPEPMRFSISGAGVPHCSCFTGGATSISAEIGPSIRTHSLSAAITSASDHTSGFGGSGSAAVSVLPSGDGLASGDALVSDDGTGTLPGVSAAAMPDGRRAGSSVAIPDGVRVGSTSSSRLACLARRLEATSCTRLSSGSAAAALPLAGVAVGPAATRASMAGSGRTRAISTLVSAGLFAVTAAGTVAVPLRGTTGISANPSDEGNR